MNGEMQSDSSSNPKRLPASVSDKEWGLIEKLLLSASAEQRKARRWGIFFKLLTFIYLFLLLLAMSAGLGDKVASVAEPHTALVDIRGMIAADQEASADNIVSGLRSAFESSNVKGVILRINSPGGSPVQAGYVYDEIKRLRAKNPDVKVYAVISDLGASGAYYIASAADEIYADKASLVGSIGVIASGFGFVGTLEKLGVERRVYTAGENKDFLDPFLPEDSTQKQYWQSVLDTTHKQFIDQVKKGRGDRLKVDPQTFTGLVWSGEQALDKGLVDGLGSSSYVARDVIGYEKIVDYTSKSNNLESLVRKFGVSFGEGLGTFLTSASFNLQ